MNKIIIDEKTCLKHKMTIQEVLFALAFRISKGDNLSNMLAREILVDVGGKMQVTQHWSEVLDEILADSAGEQDEERLKNLATEMRKLYPEGRMTDKRTGQPTAYYFRGNVSEVTKKLKTFFTRFKDDIGNPTDAEILDATKRYVASFQGNYQQRGFRLLKYFILKDDVKQGPDGNYVEPLSYLLDFLTNKESEDTVKLGEDWTSKLI